MKKWGLIVTLFYGVVVFALLVPITMLVDTVARPSGSFEQTYTSWIPWTCAGVVMLGEMLLFWLSVDTTPQRLKPRTRILASAVSTGLLVAILTVAIALAVGLALLRGDKLFPNDSPVLVATLCAFLIPWLLWASLFYRLWRNCDDPVTRAVAWLLRGSVLELLIAVPAHVIVRRRGDCCAPYVTGWGIASGIAIMLISFGPSVLLLYKKRIERYSTRPAEGK